MAIPATPHQGPPRTIGLLRGKVGPQVTIEQHDTVVDDVSSNAPVGTIGLLNFDGQGADGLAPPDTNGAVGATQYVQWVNIEYNVYDKTTGAKILGPISGNSFWSGFGGGCQSQNAGDIIILYDQIADRWVAAQPAFDATPYLMCVAISTTNDATGSYFRYAFATPNNTRDFPDYPKWGIWPDAYYLSYEVFKNGITDNNFEACAADRTNMLIGNPATMQCFAAATGTHQGLPASLDGQNLPPAGAPNHYVHLASTTKNLDQFDFHVNFTTPSLSTFTGPTVITTAAFTEICSNGTNRNCIKQPSGGEGLDSLGDRLMYRNAYRNFGSYESMLDTHTVKPGGTSTAVGAVRWYELRSTPPGGAFTAFQSGTVQTPSISLWMASIAQDKLGDIALGFSASSTSLDPSVLYTGRVPTDGLGLMEGPKIVIKGTGVQKSTSDRWGDYSSLALDPTDDCTFFYTQEYIKTTGSFNWSTRVNSFKFTGCQ